MEHRWGQRYQVDTAMRIKDASGSLHLAKALEMSLSGAVLRIAMPLEAHVPLHIELGVGRDVAVAKGHVVRKTADGVAIEWNEFAPEALMRFLSRPVAPASTQSTAAPESPAIVQAARIGGSIA